MKRNVIVNLVNTWGNDAINCGLMSQSDLSEWQEKYLAIGKDECWEAYHAFRQFIFSNELEVFPLYVFTQVLYEEVFGYNPNATFNNAVEYFTSLFNEDIRTDNIPNYDQWLEFWAQRS